VQSVFFLTVSVVFLTVSVFFLSVSVCFLTVSVFFLTVSADFLKFKYIFCQIWQIPTGFKSQRATVSAPNHPRISRENGHPAVPSGVCDPSNNIPRCTFRHIIAKPTEHKRSLIRLPGPIVRILHKRSLIRLSGPIEAERT
jgi:hypothetical protein